MKSMLLGRNYNGKSRAVRERKKRCLKIGIILFQKERILELSWVQFAGMRRLKGYYHSYALVLTQPNAVSYSCF